MGVLVEPLVVEGILGAYPQAGVLLEHLVNQVLALSGDLVPILGLVSDVAALVLHENIVDVGAGKGRSAGQPINNRISKFNIIYMTYRMTPALNISAL